MPRKKKISDDAVLEAAVRVMSRVGPDRFTLATVAQESGIAAATLVQRFGSKREMLLAIASSAPAGIFEAFEQGLGAQPASPLEALLDVYERTARKHGEATDLAHQLAFLQMDLIDPDFRNYRAQCLSEMEKGTLRMLWAAAKSGEIEEARGAALARLVVTVYQGALLYGCVFGDQEIGRAVRAQIAALLAPYRRTISVGTA